MLSRPIQPGGFSFGAILSVFVISLSILGIFRAWRDVFPVFSDRVSSFANSY